MRRVSWIIGFIGVIFLLSLIVLLYSIYQLYLTHSEESKALKEWEQQSLVQEHDDPEVENLMVGSDIEEDQKQKENTKNDVIGSIAITKLKGKWPIIEGTGSSQLARGVGHFKGSALPGDIGNAILSGHRETVFRKLGMVELDDTIEVETLEGKYKYKVNDIQIVDKDDRSITVHSDQAILTLITCYPFQFVGSSPERYIVIAELVD